MSLELMQLSSVAEVAELAALLSLGYFIIMFYLSSSSWLCLAECVPSDVTEQQKLFCPFSLPLAT